jgi:hypothetical protein
VRRLFLLLFLPLRAPMLLLLLLVSAFMGLHWADVDPALIQEAQGTATRAMAGPFFWPLQCLQAVFVVVLCTMPDLLMREISLLMASSKALTLVVTLLAVITGGLYMLHLAVFAEVLVLASAVLLARLDLTRLRVVPPPLLGCVAISGWVLLGIAIGRSLHNRLGSYLS